MLAEKIYKIQKELEEKRRSRMEAQAKIPGTAVHPRGPPPQIVRQPTQSMFLLYRNALKCSAFICGRNISDLFWFC